MAGYLTWRALNNPRVSSTLTLLPSRLHPTCSFHSPPTPHPRHSPPRCQRWSPQNPATHKPFVRSFRQTPPNLYQSKLTPAEVTNILRKNEFSCNNLPQGVVKSFDMNTVQSNSPIEDSHSEAHLKCGSGMSGMLFGIFDGHGGAACGQVVAKRLFHYIAAGLLSPSQLEKHIHDVVSDIKDDEKDIIKCYNDHFELIQELRDLYQESYLQYLNELKPKALKNEATMSNISDILTHAFLTVDSDMSREAIPRQGHQVNMKTLTVAMSGAVSVVAHINGPHLHVASTGDCTAVIGSLSETETWIANKLTTEHNSDNSKEVKRILSEHPESEHYDIIKGDRLLSMLAPLRAFGDFKFKWNRETIEDTLGWVLGKDDACPPNYKTPPYLTAKPDVTYHKLTPRDKFMVIGSDGLWDMMTPTRVIQLVGEHMAGKVTLDPLNLKDHNVSLKGIAALLKERQAAMKLKPTDANAATHLIRTALGGTAYGVDHGRLSQMLSLPQDMVRMFRDDITITVVFFDDEFLRHN